jgi:outer membrane protein TolC
MQKMAQQRHAAGVTSDAEVREAEQRCRQARSQERLLERRLALRAAFLDGRTPAPQAELDDLRIGAECTAADQRDALEAAHGDLAQAQALAAAGAISQHEVRTAERRVSEFEAALRLAELELDVLAKEPAR